MSNNAQLPVEVMKQINDEADKYGFVVPYDGSNKFYDDGRVNGYIAGATEWAQWKVKYDELKTQFDNLQTVYADLFNTAQNSANKHQQLKERCEKMEAALIKIIEMNRQHAADQYGDANKAETWGCIRVSREALAHKHEGINEKEGEDDKCRCILPNYNAFTGKCLTCGKQ